MVRITAYWPRMCPAACPRLAPTQLLVVICVGCVLSLFTLPTLCTRLTLLPLPPGASSSIHPCVQWDVLAGVTVGFMVVPQGMSYAILAGKTAQLHLPSPLYHSRDTAASVYRAQKCLDPPTCGIPWVSWFPRSPAGA